MSQVSVLSIYGTEWPRETKLIHQYNVKTTFGVQKLLLGLYAYAEDNLVVK